MPRSRKEQSPAAYQDVKYVLDLALKKPGLRYELSTPGRAINFKQRCYMYRNLLREMAQEAIALPGQRAEVSYDLLIIKQVNDEGKPDKQAGRILIFEHHIPEGRLIDPETGEEIDVNIPGLTDYISE